MVTATCGWCDRSTTSELCEVCASAEDVRTSCAEFKPDRPTRRNVKSEVGNGYGSLTVLAYVPPALLSPDIGDVISGSRAHWLCRCECGHWAIAAGQKLRLGRRKACGRGHHMKLKGVPVPPAVAQTQLELEAIARALGLAA